MLQKSLAMHLAENKHHGSVRGPRGFLGCSGIPHTFSARERRGEGMRPSAHPALLSAEPWGSQLVEGSPPCASQHHALPVHPRLFTFLPSSPG